MLRSSDGRTRELATTGPLLGIIPDLPAADAAVAVEPGARLLLYTDGLTELQAPSGGLWGIEEATQLLETSGAMPLAVFLEQIIGRVATLRRGEAAGDDLTVVVATIRTDTTWPATRGSDRIARNLWGNSSLTNLSHPSLTSHRNRAMKARSD